MMVFYVAAALFAQRSFHGNRLLIYPALMLNVWIIPYLSVTLTDGVYTIFALVTLVCLHGAIWHSGQRQVWFLIAAIGATSAAIAVRPAALWLAIPTSCVAILFISRHRIRTRHVIAVVAALIPIAWQSAINFAWSGTLSPFPVVGLGSLQVTWGILYTKYATFLGAGGPSVYYSSGVTTLSESSSPYMWWFSNPTESVPLLGLKVAAAFDFDYWIPYPSKLNSTYTLTIATVLVLSLFLYLTIGEVIDWTVKAQADSILAIIAFAAWALFTLSTAMENRFTLPMVTYMIFFTALKLQVPGDKCSRVRLLVPAVAVVWVASLAPVVRLQSTLNGLL